MLRARRGTRAAIIPPAGRWIGGRLLRLALPALFALGFAAAGAIQAGAGAAQPRAGPVGDFSGPEVCRVCHEEIHAAWQGTLHANAFSSPIFQQNWAELGGQFSCLSCHTTGYDPATNQYAFEGVTCEACHGPFQEGHPAEPMPITADASLCARCHQTTKDEWDTSRHGQVGIQCESCHNPHSQQPRAASVTELCTNCHKQRGESFTHGTHASAGLECASCHMYTDPASNPPVQGLVATGHTFTVGSQACIGCHQDTVHTRDSILRLAGELEAQGEVDLPSLQQQVQQQAETIAELEASRSARLYVGLAQGAIVGLATGGVAAWIVGRRLGADDPEPQDPDPLQAHPGPGTEGPQV